MNTYGQKSRKRNRKQILILKGSPREGGNSDILAERLAQGTREVGAQVESLSIHPMDIRPCDACDTCRETGGVCVIQDDMQVLYPKIIRADALIVATPIYWYTFSAQTKLWIDRCYALVMNPEGDVMEDKDYALLMTHASNTLTSGVLNAMQTYKDMFSRGQIVGVVHGQANQAGEILDRPDILQQAFELGKELGQVKE